MSANDGVAEMNCDSESTASENDSDWKEIDTDDDNNENHTSCLFCPQIYRTTTEALTHCNKDHDFDLVKLKARFHMDCYGYIKLINYIQTLHPEAAFLMAATEPVWDEGKYMTPVNHNDPWLMYDFDDIEIPSPLPFSENPNSGYHVNAEDGRVTLSEQHFAELQRTIQQLTAQVQEKEATVNTLLENIKRMQHITQELVASGEGESQVIPARCVKALKLEDDEGYFNTYSHFSIHHEMLSDHVRTSSYRDAILNNAELLKNKTVLDLGCGTGILSMFAASAGAQKVIAVDQSDIVFHAMEIIRENKLKNKIEFVKGRIEDVELPLTHVDVIVSEWMGYFLLFEGMLDSVIYAREHHLSEGGILLPNRCTINLMGVADPGQYANFVGFWSDVYGFRMSCLKREVVREATIQVVPFENIITTSCLLTNLDLNHCTEESYNFSTDIELSVTKDGSLTALLGYFDVFFDLPHPVSFSTGPHSESTHWKQTVFLLEEPIDVKQGEVLTGKLICQRQQRDIRSLKVTISLKGRTLTFIIS